MYIHSSLFFSFFLTGATIAPIAAAATVHITIDIPVEIKWNIGT